MLGSAVVKAAGGCGCSCFESGINPWSMRTSSSSSGVSGPTGEDDPGSDKLARWRSKEEEGEENA